MTHVKVSLEAVFEKSKMALIRHGASEFAAKEVAKAIQKAEATGNLICGLYYLESYCKQLASGRVNGSVEPRLRSPKPASLEVDARFGFAQPAFAHGLGKAVEITQGHGICAFAVSHAHTCTSLGYFTEQIAVAGLIGIGFTNATPVVSPPGGHKAVIGTNPIAFSVPAQTGGIAFQFDQSTSAVALGKITMAAAAGDTIPLGWAVDAQGQPTTDPTAAMAGSLVSTGGYKGWGFGLMAEVLAAALTGSVNSLDVQGLKAPEGKPHDLGQFYILIDPCVFSKDVFWDRLKRLSDAVAEQPEARLPGTGKALPQNVKVEEKVWNQVLYLAG